MARSKFDLASLIRTQQGTVSESDTGEVRQIPVDLLDDNADNFYSVADLQGLCDSISVSGVLQPILVTPIDGGRYRIIAGHRRTAAVKQLRKDLAKESGGTVDDRYTTIPAMVRTAATSETEKLLEKLALITTNSAARRLSDSEIAKQAAQMQEILVGLKAQGFQFPGRMRKLVADAVGVSETKLAKLKVIREKLIPEWLELWEAGSVPEYLGEALSRVPIEVQPLVLGVKELTPSRVFEISRLYQEKHSERQCQVDAERMCHYQGIMWDRSLPKLKTGQGFACTTCCRRCWQNRDCKEVCPIAAADKDACEAKSAAEYAAKQKVQSEAHTIERRNAEKLWGRIAERMLSLDLDVDDMEEATLADRDMFYEYAVDRSELEPHEARMDPDDIMDSDQTLATARVLGVPVEWIMDPDMEELPSPGGMWQDAAQVHPDDGDMVLILRYGTLIDWKHDPHSAFYRNGQYLHTEDAAADLPWRDVRYWVPWPGGLNNEA